MISLSPGNGRFFFLISSSCHIAIPFDLRRGQLRRYLFSIYIPFSSYRLLSTYTYTVHITAHNGIHTYRLVSKICSSFDKKMKYLRVISSFHTTHYFDYFVQRSPLDVGNYMQNLIFFSFKFVLFKGHHGFKIDFGE